MGFVGSRVSSAGLVKWNGPGLGSQWRRWFGEERSEHNLVYFCGLWVAKVLVSREKFRFDFCGLLGSGGKKGTNRRAGARAQVAGVAPSHTSRTAGNHRFCGVHCPCLLLAALGKRKRIPRDEGMALVACCSRSSGPWLLSAVLQATHATQAGESHDTPGPRGCLALAVRRRWVGDARAQTVFKPPTPCIAATTRRPSCRQSCRDIPCASLWLAWLLAFRGTRDGLRREAGGCCQEENHGQRQHNGTARQSVSCPSWLRKHIRERRHGTAESRVAKDHRRTGNDETFTASTANTANSPSSSILPVIPRPMQQTAAS